MATYTINEMIARVDGYLDKVAGKAQEYMSDYIQKNATKGYATNTLSSSINVETISKNERSVGSGLVNDKSGFVYGHAVDKGRGPVTAKNAPLLRYYDTKLGRWINTKSVKGMSGINFISETKKYLERTHIPL